MRKAFVDQYMVRSLVTTINGNLKGRRPDQIPPLIDGYRTMYHDKDLAPRLASNILKDHTVPGEDIEYKLNEDFFRSETFKKLDPSFINIVVAGCSWTFGQGVPATHTWHALLGKHIENKLGKPVKVHNLGIMGGSSHLAIKNVISFIELYGKPDYVFFAFPGWYRDIGFNKIGTFAMNVSTAMPSNKDKDEQEVIKNFVNRFDELSSKNAFFTQIHLTELYLNSAGINFRWIMTSLNGEDLSEAFGFSNQVVINHTFLPNTARRSPTSDLEKHPNVDGLEYWQLAKDGFHPGIAWHDDAATTIFKDLFDENA